MSRKLVLLALKACGTVNDRKGWARLYVENRISLKVANDCWHEGQKFAKFVEQRDSGG